MYTEPPNFVRFLRHPTMRFRIRFRMCSRTAGTGRFWKHYCRSPGIHTSKWLWQLYKDPAKSRGTKTSFSCMNQSGFSVVDEQQDGRPSHSNQVFYENSVIILGRDVLVYNLQRRASNFWINAHRYSEQSFTTQIDESSPQHETIIKPDHISTSKHH